MKNVLFYQAFCHGSKFSLVLHGVVEAQEVWWLTIVLNSLKKLIKLSQIII